MKLGIIAPYAPVDLSRATKRGLEYVEFCFNNNEEAKAFIANYDNIKAELDKTGIKLSSAGRWNSEPNKGAAGLDREIMDLQKATIDKAAALGASVFTCGCNYDESVSLYKNYCNAVEYFSEICEYAKAQGLKTAVYNCDWNNFVRCDRHWEVVLGEVKDLYLKYDCSHAYYHGDDYKEEIYKWGDRIAHMHLKGAVSANGKHVDDSPAGMDCIDWNFVLTSLYKVGYDGVLSIEPHSSTWRGELGEKGIDFTVNFFKDKLL